MRTALLSHPECLLHDSGPHHPEAAERLQAIDDRLIAAGLMHLLRHYDAPLVSREQLLRVHSADYLDRLEQLRPSHGRVMLDPDTALGPLSLRAAQRAAGALVKAVELVVSGEMETAFCNVRPPGHHAGAGNGAGFCIFNNVAVGAAHALRGLGLERVAILDFDVHHGNGTEAIFAGDSRILLCSTFQHPYYPHTEPGSGAANIIHAPLPAGSYGDAFAEAVEGRWLPALEGFAPQLVLVSAGFDGHFEDDMGGLNLLDADYYQVTRTIMDVARRYAGGRVVSTLEGGYVLDALGRSAAAHIRALMGL